MNNKSVDVYERASSCSLFLSARQLCGRGRRAEVADCVRRSRQHAALEQKGEGFENKIAEVIGESLGTGVQYYWRPSIERGLMRKTLSEELRSVAGHGLAIPKAVVLSPLYRSTFVLATATTGIDFKNLDDPALKKLASACFRSPLYVRRWPSTMSSRIP